MRVARTRLQALPQIVSEMVKPAEKIDSIKIHHVTGLGNNSTGENGSSTAKGSDKPVDQHAIDSILDMAVQLPALKRIGQELGIAVDGGVTGVGCNIFFRYIIKCRM